MRQQAPCRRHNTGRKTTPVPDDARTLSSSSRHICASKRPCSATAAMAFLDRQSSTLSLARCTRSCRARYAPTPQVDDCVHGSSAAQKCVCVCACVCGGAHQQHHTTINSTASSLQHHQHNIDTTASPAHEIDTNTTAQGHTSARSTSLQGVLSPAAPFQKLCAVKPNSTAIRRSLAASSTPPLADGSVVSTVSVGDSTATPDRPRPTNDADADRSTAIVAWYSSTDTGAVMIDTCAALAVTARASLMEPAAVKPLHTPFRKTGPKP
jgi:hypothetical protein